MEEESKSKRRVSNLISWEEAGLYPEILDYFAGTHYKDTGDRAWEMLHGQIFMQLN